MFSSPMVSLNDINPQRFCKENVHLKGSKEVCRMSDLNDFQKLFGDMS